MTEEVVGFTRNQRKWFLRRDKNRCQFRWFDGTRWVQCNSTRNIQVHHIIPRGWARIHMPKSFNLNGSMNGICLCDIHHVGKSYVHSDTHAAKMQYNRGDKEAFRKMMDKRKVLNNRGIPYWNTRWDMSFSRISRKNTLRFIRSNPYPSNGNRGNTGRI